MSEPTDLEQIAALEERITTALDRIARGVASRKADTSGQTTDEISGELQERLAAQVAALEETQSALAAEQLAHAAISERLRAVEEARKADADEAARELAKAQEAVPVETAQPPAVDSADQEKLEAELEHRRSVEDVLRRRIGRLREDRNAARSENSEAREQLDEVQTKLEQLSAVVDVESSGAAELLRLRESNRSLRDTIEEMREGISDDAVANTDLVTAALSAELESLRAERAADAHEARSILAEIQPILEGGSANA